MLTVMLANEVHRHLNDHARALVVHACARLLHVKAGAILGEWLEHLERLLTVHNLVGIVRGHAGQALALRSLFEEIDIAVIALQTKHERVGRQRAKVVV